MDDMPKEPISRWQWLNQRGGRIETDVLRDGHGEYILMRDGANKLDYKIYLPEKFQRWQK